LGLVVVPVEFAPLVVLVPEVELPEPLLLWAEAGTAKGTVVKLKVKAPAQKTLVKSEGFIVCGSSYLLDPFGFLFTKRVLLT
ncbi:MAG TPA: hypothetical protein DCE56_07225, partial [Cyanobacteria bacterium UBA8553]|nr:hypothetical protein [Cyanobacteria bacterium UBA8553]HAJ58672.1 hypothetical protein [Cyanobacteria bacterium UBA8543]